MAIILFYTEAIHCNIFRCNYLKNKKHFLHFYFLFFPFGKLNLIWNIFKKKMMLIVDVFLNLWTPKNVVRQMPKKSCFKGPLNK